MRALVTGGTGFIGKRLLARLTQPIAASRNIITAARALASLPSQVELVEWDPNTGPPPPAALAGVDVVFHLAGDSVAEGRWSDDKKQRIRDSRIVGTRHLVSGLREAKARPRVLVCASAIGYYGSRGDESLDEKSAPGDDFLAAVCRDWEAEAVAAKELGIRVVTPRIGIVLGPDGGALQAMLAPFRLGLGGKLGDGHQWMSWIHVDDLVGLLLHGAQHPEIEGAMNATAPNPVTNAEFTHALAAALERPAIFGVPAMALKVALGEKAVIALGSQRALPRVAESSGYQFAHPLLDEALRDVLGKK